jgi:hypothetical protein
MVSPAEDTHQGSLPAPDSHLDSLLDLPLVTTITTVMEDLTLPVLQAACLLASPRAPVPLVDSKVVRLVVRVPSPFFHRQPLPLVLWRERSRKTSAAFMLARFVLWCSRYRTVVSFAAVFKIDQCCVFL